MTWPLKKSQSIFPTPQDFTLPNFLTPWGIPGKIIIYPWRGGAIRIISGIVQWVGSSYDSPNRHSVFIKNGLIMIVCIQNPWLTYSTGRSRITAGKVVARYQKMLPDQWSRCIASILTISYQLKLSKTLYQRAVETISRVSFLNATIPSLKSSSSFLFTSALNLVILEQVRNIATHTAKWQRLLRVRKNPTNMAATQPVMSSDLFVRARRTIAPDTKTAKPARIGKERSIVYKSNTWASQGLTQKDGLWTY